MALHSSMPLGREHGQPDMHPPAQRCRRCGIVIGYGERCEFCLDRPEDHVDQPGEHVGRHHTEWIPTVEALIADDNLDAAELLLWRLVEATEAEALLAGVRPLEQHFRRLGWIAQKRGDATLAKRLRQRFEECQAAVSPSSGSAAG
jgi:hypothetical protein